MDTVTLTIDGRDLQTRKGATVLQAALEANIYIPDLNIIHNIKSKKY